MLGGAGSPGGDDLLTVTVVRDEHGYGMKVSGDNPVYVQSVKEHGAAWRAGLRAGDRILRVDSVPVHHHTHQQVVHMIRANPTTVLTVQQNSSRHKTPITAPVPVNSEKQRQLEVSKVHTVRLMLEQEQKFIRDLRNELLKVPDVRKQTQLESAEQRCSKLQHEIDTIMAGQPLEAAPSTPRPRNKTTLDKPSPVPNTGFLSGLPRSLSNLTGQSLRNLRQARTNKIQQENTPPLVRQNSDESNNKRRHVHNNTVPMVPTTCLDNVTPPPLPPRSIERPKRNPLSPNLSPPPINPLAKPKPTNSTASPSHKQYYKGRYYPGEKLMHQSMPAYDPKQLRRSSHSLDGELDGPQPNSIAMQMSYPLVNAPPPPLQTDNRTGVPVLHMRSRSSPEQLDHDLKRSSIGPSPLIGAMSLTPSASSPCAAPLAPCGSPLHKECCDRDTPPPGTPPPPYHTNTQPCADPQRAIISMEEDDSPASDTSTYSGLFSNLRSVRESKARTAVLLNWLLGERRCACACLLLVLTDGYRSASGVHTHTLRRWAYEIHSTFLVPNAALQLSGVDENMANEIEHVLVNEFDKEELLRNVFRKARQRAKDELSQQLTEFQVKRQVGLGTLYGPEDSVIDKCDVDKAQELVVVEQLMCGQLRSLCAAGGAACAAAHHDAHATLMAALIAAALCLHCRPASVAAAVGGSRASFLQRDKLYKQRVKQITKQHSQPFVVRGHHLQLQALTSVAHCHHCDNIIWGLAPQAYVCTDCKLRVHRTCARSVEEGCCLDGEHHNNRISRFMERIHANNQPMNLDANDKKSRKTSGTTHFLNMERSFRKAEDDPPWEATLTPSVIAHEYYMVGQMMWFKREPKTAVDKENGMVGKLRRKKPVVLKPTRESSERETSTESDKERRRYSDILDVVSIERRDESDESLYESADGHSDAISASDDTLPRLGKTPTISKESLKLAVTDEEVDFAKTKKGHRKTMSLSNPLEIVRNLGDEWFESAKRELEKNSDKKKSRESLWSEEDRDSIHGSTMKLDQLRKNSKKEDKNQANLRKTSTNEAPKSRKTSKGSSVSALNFLRRKKTPTSTKPVESVAEDDKGNSADEIMNFTKLFLECEKRFASISETRPIRPVETDSEDETPTPKQLADHRRRLSRQTSRSKSKARGKSQSLKVNTLRKSHSGTLKKGKKKSVKTPSSGRSRQASIVEQTPISKKKHTDSSKPNSWLFSGSRGESRREGSTDEPTAPDADVDTSDANTKEPDKDNNWRSPAIGGARGVNRAESCRERDAPRRGKHRNASDPNRLTAHNNHDLEPGAATAPSGSSSSSSLSSRSNESNTVAAEQQASQSDWSEEEEPLAAQWADSLPPHALDTLDLSATLRKRQEVIHELIVSEGSHVRWLRVLGVVFLRPLERSGHLLAGDELKSLFPNLPAVRERHSRLYSDLRTARNEADNHLVQIRPVADALLNALGDSGYASCVSKFCRGQRMALEALRERRRKSKELHQFLAAREQQPLCGRLQLKDMLACVWQRLTKYQLLLEGILKTVTEGEETEEDLARLRRAHDVARDVLHRVDTAIRTAENEHRLKTIQSKLEVRVPTSGEWEELRRLDLTQHSLRNEGDLTLRNDSSKRINVLALMLEDSLVLLQRESDKFILKPIPQPSQSLMLSPLIKWDKVLFRPNAAVRNTFFLMNINGVQMHELSANSAPEYSSWVKHIQEAPLAKLTELKSTITPAHAQPRPAEDSGVNVSRNPSDASEKSSSTAPDEPVEPEKERVSVDRTSVERDEKREEDKRSAERESSAENAEVKEEKEDKHKPRRPTVGRISTHGASPGALESPRAIRVQPPAAAAARTAHRAFTDQERLRRLDDVISRALRAKSSVVGAVLGVPPNSFAHFADLAVADALGEVDVCSELRMSGSRLSRSSSRDDDVPAGAPDLHQLLLAAHAQATQLTRSLQRALNVTEAETVAARAGAGRCDACRRPQALAHEQESFELVACGDEVPELPAPPAASADALERDAADALGDFSSLAHDDSGGERDSADDALECSGSAALLASRLVGVSCGLQATLARAVTALSASSLERAAREELVLLREQNDRLRARTSNDQHTTEEISVPKAGLDPSIQEQPSNGG